MFGLILLCYWLGVDEKMVFWVVLEEFMKKFVLFFVFMSLLFFVVVSMLGNNFVVFNDGVKFCYDGYVVVDGKEFKMLNKSVEMCMSVMLSGLGIKVFEFDVVDCCDCVVFFIYEMDNKGVFGIVVVCLELLSNLIFDND